MVPTKIFPMDGDRCKDLDEFHCRKPFFIHSPNGGGGYHHAVQAHRRTDRDSIPDILRGIYQRWYYSHVKFKVSLIVPNACTGSFFFNKVHMWKTNHMYVKDSCLGRSTIMGMFWTINRLLILTCLCYLKWVTELETFQLWNVILNKSNE